MFIVRTYTIISTCKHVNTNQKNPRVVRSLRCMNEIWDPSVYYDEIKLKRVARVPLLFRVVLTRYRASFEIIISMISDPLIYPFNRRNENFIKTEISALTFNRAFLQRDRYSYLEFCRIRENKSPQLVEENTLEIKLLRISWKEVNLKGDR